MRIVIPILLLAFTGCSPAITVYHDYDKSIDFTLYRTFDWKMDLDLESRQNPLYYNELTDKRIREAVVEALSEKGYNKTISNPDFQIHYHIMVEDKSIATLDPSGHNYDAYWLGTAATTYQYKEGTLIIDLMDADTNKLIWRGWAVAVLEDLRREVVEKRMKQTIARILGALPNDVKK
jgi:Domain of unknown function (DUF4136)